MASSFNLQTFNTPISTKLDDENFLIWEQQVHATIRGFNLGKYLLENSVPEKFKTKEDEAENKIREEYLQYDQQDQLVVAWLLASMTTPILTKMVGLVRTHQIWKRLETYFASQTRAKIKKLKLQLQMSKKNSTVTKYLLSIKKTVDSLAAVGSPISEEEHIEAILDGLPEEFDSFITCITSRLDPYSVDDIEALLLAQEERFEKHRKTEQNFIQANTATVNSQMGHFGRGRGEQQYARGTNYGRGGRNNNRGGFNNYEEEEIHPEEDLTETIGFNPIKIIGIILNCSVRFVENLGMWLLIVGRGIIKNFNNLHRLIPLNFIPMHQSILTKEALPFHQLFKILCGILIVGPHII
ncbi:uncharacterized protein LOC109801728 [Cajanus cajan]|uniref:Retrovirus-related Pol polyprotein from transposon TNT 1-94 n=1 Tax=Cajanus cajan TaxID=3821 RepID=A0A151TCY3_CAJCA|nr:uncharacterized protein LOC109801728 [Cajanus cajan]XP_029128072.1 uncharacterized protein LOC109801728 [Cajanus cajan]KYP64897.1 hypothetical protein KK1_019510 [Cajanus cajan]